MAGETIITVAGNLTADPELRYTPSGAAVANFTIATNPRTFDRQANEWKDGEPLFMRCSAWRDMGENVAASLTKGARVVAQGHLKARSYQDREGNDRTAWELDVQDIGPSLRRATAKVTRTGQPGAAQGGGSGQWGGQPPQGQGAGQTGQWGGAPAQDPWGGDGWDTPSSGEPAF